MVFCIGENKLAVKGHNYEAIMHSVHESYSKITVFFYVLKCFCLVGLFDNVLADLVDKSHL